VIVWRGHSCPRFLLFRRTTELASCPRSQCFVLPVLSGTMASPRGDGMYHPNTQCRIVFSTLVIPKAFRPEESASWIELPPPALREP